MNFLVIQDIQAPKYSLVKSPVFTGLHPPSSSVATDPQEVEELRQELEKARLRSGGDRFAEDFWWTVEPNAIENGHL